MRAVVAVSVLLTMLIGCGSSPQDKGDPSGDAMTPSGQGDGGIETGAMARGMVVLAAASATAASSAKEASQRGAQRVQTSRTSGRRTGRSSASIPIQTVHVRRNTGLPSTSNAVLHGGRSATVAWLNYTGIFYTFDLNKKSGCQVALIPDGRLGTGWHGLFGRRGGWHRRYPLPRQ